MQSLTIGGVCSEKEVDARLRHLTVIRMIGKNVRESVILRIERGKERKDKSTVTPTEQDTTRSHGPTMRIGDGGSAESMRLSES